jgi:hypothetical protein
MREPFSPLSERQKSFKIPGDSSAVIVKPLGEISSAETNGLWINASSMSSDSSLS